MLLQNRSVWDIDITRDGFALESSVCDIVHIDTSRLNTEAGRKAI